MKPKSVQQIGKRFENWGNEMIEEAGLGRAIRTPGSGSGKIKGDSFNNLDFMIEFKSERNPSWKGNIAQAKRQAEQGNYDSDKWIMVQRDPESPQANPQAFAIIDYIQLLKLLKKNSEPLIKEPDRSLRWALEKLKNSINNVMRKIK